ncbi:pyridoxamine 5'-phosphate oxidase family protein [Brevibacterium sp. R8603A2]|uniref:pyridoxamine 5'-phosphate oxidase family protein n=1 Tax=Brevibacterium sp. R8603A2 TaxID=2929779 RepID=UPI001FF70C22|nr:pyridoxamine 5'-phosphate oxidase family protein [Brevibacterium sp. R8603A2]MCK1802663.1 pyridoxamine 5'-phosphate oxidase family protein [Brevibacterium sp. R8603A2]
MNDTPRTSEAELREKVRELMNDTRIAMLTSVDTDGTLVSRPMGTQEVVEDGDVWFITAADSDIVDELAVDSQVNVAYSDKSSWVSLSGTATVIRDVAKQKELWNTFTSAWFDGGADDPAVRLIRFTPHTAQFWDSPGGVRTMLSMLTSAATKGTPKAGESRTVQM